MNTSATNANAVPNLWRLISILSDSVIDVIALRGSVVCATGNALVAP